jgi:IQ and AAA domain-containing protein
MSFRFYGKLWLATKEDLQDVLLREKVAQKLTPTKDSLIAHRVLASLYARYVILCNQLSDIYDQTLQVQKRHLLEKILTAASNRLLELQKHLRKIELSEFIYIDQTLHELKLIPQDVQILRPFHFPLRREQLIQDLLDDKAEKAVEEPVVRQGLDRFRPVLTAEQKEAQRLRQVFVGAVNLIKSHEKARQARVYLGNIMRDPEKYWPQPPEETVCQVPYEFYHRADQRPLIPIKRTQYRTDFRVESPVVLGRFSFYEPPSSKKVEKTIVRPAEDQTSDQTNLQEQPDLAIQRKSSAERDSELRQEQALAALEAQQNKAATIIQRSFHRYRLKKRVADRKLQKLKLLRMIDDRKFDFSMAENIEQTRAKRRSKKAAYDVAFLQAIEDERARIVKLKSPWIMEDISDHIRAWFREFYDKTGDFDRYPTVLEGGTILVIRGETATVEEFLQRKKEQELEKKKSKEQKKNEREEKKAARAAAKEKAKVEKAKLKELKRLKKEKEKKEGVTYDFTEPEFMTKAYIDLDQSMAEYETEWRFIEEMKNVYEAPIAEWISLDKFA